MNGPAESRLILDGVEIWRNPPGVGHFGIKFRKQQREEEIIGRMIARHRMRQFLKYNDEPLPPNLGTSSETPQEIERAMNRGYPN